MKRNRIKAEVVAQVVGPMFCGTGGCPLFIFREPSPGRLELVTQMSLFKDPLIVAAGTIPSALITGASSGIGAALARQLAPVPRGTGEVLVLTARRLDRLDQEAPTSCWRSCGGGDWWCGRW